MALLIFSHWQVIKKGSKHKGFVRNGLKDVQVNILDITPKLCQEKYIHNLYKFIGAYPQGGDWSCDFCWGRHTNRGLLQTEIEKFEIVQHYTVVNPVPYVKILHNRSCATCLQCARRRVCHMSTHLPGAQLSF